MPNKQTAKKATARRPGRQPADRQPPGGAPAPAPRASVPGAIDLDAARAARREAAGGHIAVTLGGEGFKLPMELPLDAIEPLAELAELQNVAEEASDQEQAAMLQGVRHAMEASLAALFCDEGADTPRDPDTDQVLTEPEAHSEGCPWPRFRRQRPTLEDMLELWEGLFTAYGTSLGEALARTAPAASGGAP